jgi:sulfur relay (sulfurtransferase) DsrC/TusE family protein
MNSMNILILFGEGPIKKIRKTLEKNKKLRKKNKKYMFRLFRGGPH